MQICDLHTHSTFSDGTFTPTELIELAAEIGLSSVALCDHNTVDGLEEFLTAAEGKGIKAIAGSEFSVDYNGRELHLVGLFIQPEHFPKVTRLLKEAYENKEKSNRDLIDTLNRVGYEVDFETVKASTPNGRFNRAHIAAELTRKGYTSSIKQAFKTLLSREVGYYKDPQRVTLWEVLEFLTEIRAVPVLAHPFLNLNEEELEQLLPKAKDCGLIGMECYYSTYDAETTRKSLELADRFGLLCSGGSDFHGSIKPDIELGTGRGDLVIPNEWVNALEHAVR